MSIIIQSCSYMAVPAEQIPATIHDPMKQFFLPYESTWSQFIHFRCMCCLQVSWFRLRPNDHSQDKRPRQNKWNCCFASWKKKVDITMELHFEPGICSIIVGGCISKNIAFRLLLGELLSNMSMLFLLTRKFVNKELGLLRIRQCWWNFGLVWRRQERPILTIRHICWDWICHWRHVRHQLEGSHVRRSQRSVRPAAAGQWSCRIWWSLVWEVRIL